MADIQVRHCAPLYTLPKKNPNKNEHWYGEKV